MLFPKFKQTGQARVWEDVSTRPCCADSKRILMASADGLALVRKFCHPGLTQARGKATGVRAAFLFSFLFLSEAILG